MRWTRGNRSVNVEDRRGERTPSGFRRGGVQMGLGGFLILIVLSLIFRTDLLSLLGAGGGPVVTSSPRSMPRPRTTAAEEQLADFVGFVLDDLQGSWTRTLADMGAQYADAKLVLFRDAVESACGFAEAATGPFYCPADQRVYVDLAFYDQLRDRFGAPGDFAQAYVIAHEIGHHVQHVLGIEADVRRAMRANPERANELSVRLELQADCFAGVWGRDAGMRGLLEPGDLEEGLGAAAAIGDDRIQKMTRGRVSPESWTHGSSEQRVQWLRRGLASGRCEDCDTFAGLR